MLKLTEPASFEMPSYILKSDSDGDFNEVCSKA